MCFRDWCGYKSGVSNYCYSLAFRLFGAVGQNVGHTGSYIRVCVSGLGVDTSSVFQTIVIVWDSDCLVQSGRVLATRTVSYIRVCVLSC